MQDIFLFIQHQKLLVTALVIVLILLMILEFIRQKRGRGINPQLAIKMINHQNAAIIDIRPHDTFITGHIVDAISLPLAELNAKGKKLDKYKSQPIIIVCGDGAQSARTVTTLQNQGFQASYLAGGIRAWREAELPLVKGA